MQELKIMKYAKKFSFLQYLCCNIGVARGPKGPCPPKFLENIVILCFEKVFSKQNGVSRLISNILPPQKFWGWLRHWAVICATTVRTEQIRVYVSRQDQSVQNRSQKLVFTVGVYICAGRLDIDNLLKSPLIYDIP